MGMGTTAYFVGWAFVVLAFSQPYCPRGFTVRVYAAFANTVCTCIV